MFCEFRVKENDFQLKGSAWWSFKPGVKEEWTSDAQAPPDLDGRVDSPALSGRGSRPSGRTSG